MDKLTWQEVHKLPRRKWATRGDAAIESDPCDRGHHVSRDAIGGFYGVAWTECFRDAKTGETYAVECYDGTYRSKGAYEDD